MMVMALFRDQSVFLGFTHGADVCFYIGAHQLCEVFKEEWRPLSYDLISERIGLHGATVGLNFIGDLCPSAPSD